MEQLDWKILQIIHAEKTISKTAEKLYISQPAVSYRMSQMEADFQKKLFIRKKSGIEFTDAGLRLYAYAVNMLQYEKEIFQVVSQQKQDYSGQIKIGSTVNFMNKYLTKQLKDFSELYENIHISVKLHESSKLFRKLCEGELLAAVVREPLIAIANEPISKDYLQTHPFIRNDTDNSSLSIDILVKEWISGYFNEPCHFAPVAISGDSQVRISLVKAGFGWSVIPESRIVEKEGIYTQTLLQSDGSLFYFYTQMLYSEEAEHFDIYQVYLQHFFRYFTEHMID